MSPEEYAALLADAKVSLRRDLDGNYIFDATKTTTSVLPRDIIDQLEKSKAEATSAYEASMKAYDTFIAALKDAK